MNTFKEIIDCWPSHVDMAADLNVKPNRIDVWSHRDSIPSGFWSDLVACKVAKKAKVTLRVLADLSAAYRA